jgi:hypothetical protein
MTLTAIAALSDRQHPRGRLDEAMVWDPVFVMEFISFGGGVPPAEVASGGDEPDGSRGGEAVEKWW